MAINITCECGKRLRAMDEYAGRKGICPALRPQVHDAIRGPSPRNRPVPAARRVRRGHDGDAAEQPDLKRSIWTKPVVLIGTAAPTLILATLCGYMLWRSEMFAEKKPVAMTRAIAPARSSRS